MLACIVQTDSDITSILKVGLNSSNWDGPFNLKETSVIAFG